MTLTTLFLLAHFGIGVPRWLPVPPPMNPCPVGWTHLGVAHEAQVECTPDDDYFVRAVTGRKLEPCPDGFSERFVSILAACVREGAVEAFEPRESPWECRPGRNPAVALHPSVVGAVCRRVR